MVCYSIFTNITCTCLPLYYIYLQDPHKKSPLQRRKREMEKTLTLIPVSLIAQTWKTLFLPLTLYVEPPTTVVIVILLDMPREHLHLRILVRSTDRSMEATVTGQILTTIQRHWVIPAASLDLIQWLKQEEKKEPCQVMLCTLRWDLWISASLYKNH